MSPSGRFRPIPPGLPANPCRLRPESGHEAGPKRVQTVLRSATIPGFKLHNWELRIMRYELTDDEWTAIRPMLPNKPHGVPG